MEVVVLVWLLAYTFVSYIQSSTEEQLAKRANILMAVLGYMSIGFAYIFADTWWSYVLSALLLTSVHFIYNNIYKSFLAIVLIYFGYLAKF